MWNSQEGGGTNLCAPFFTQTTLKRKEEGAVSWGGEGPETRGSEYTWVHGDGFGTRPIVYVIIKTTFRFKR